MRALCIYLPKLAMMVADRQVRARGEALRPARAVYVTEKPLKGSDITGNMRIFDASYGALRLGVKPAFTIARARIRATDLALEIVQASELQNELQRLAECMLTYGAQVGLPKPSDHGGLSCIWVDTTGCFGLFGKDQTQGEAVLVANAMRTLHSLGHEAQVALADGPRVAQMFARIALESPLIIAPGGNAQAMANLPIALLPLEEASQRLLEKVGVGTIAALRALPKSSLVARLGQNPSEILCLLQGDDRAPLRAYKAPDCPAESIELERETADLESLSFVLKSICDRLALRLLGRGMAASEIELVLSLDASIVALLTTQKSTEGKTTREDANEIRHTFVLSVPLSEPDAFLSLLRGRLGHTALKAPVKRVTCTLQKLVPKSVHNASLFSNELKSLGAFEKVLAELEADLGSERVGRLEMHSAWELSARSHLTAWGNPQRLRLANSAAAPKRADTVEKLAFSQLNVVEPTRLLPFPVRLTCEVQPIRLVLRHECVAWWKSHDMPRELLFAYAEEKAMLVERNAKGTFLLGYM